MVPQLLLHARCGFPELEWRHRCDIPHAWTSGQKRTADTDVYEMVRNVSVEVSDAFHHHQQQLGALNILWV